MIINLQQLKKLPVVTKSGMKLGKVIDINFLADNQTIFQYVVRPSFFSGRTFLITTTQVLEIADNIVVDDALVLDKSKTDDQPTKFIDNNILDGVVTREINQD